MATKIQELRAEFTADLKGLNKGISTAQQKMTMFGSKVKEVGKTITSVGKKLAKWGTIATGALVAVGVGVTKMAGNFQSALTDTMSMTGLAGEAYDKMREKLGKLAVAHSEMFGIDAVEIIRSYYDVLSAGAKAGTEDFKALAEAAFTLTRVTGIETRAAVEALNDALRSFGMEISEAGRMADVFFKTSQLAATTVPQLAEAMKEAGKIGSEMGISLEDTAAILAGFASTGTRAANAGTAFRMIMVKLSAPSKDANEALATLNTTIFDSAGRMRPILDILVDLKTGLAKVTDEERKLALKSIAGEEAISKFGALLNSDLSILRDWSEELKKSGALNEAFTRKMGDFNVQAGVLWIKVKNIVTQFGLKLLPSIGKLIKRMGKWIEENRELIDQKLDELAQKIAGAFEKVDVVLGKVLWVMGLIAEHPMAAAIAGLILLLAPLTAVLGFVAIGIGGIVTAAGALMPVLAGIGVPVLVLVAALTGLGVAFAVNGRKIAKFFGLTGALSDIWKTALARDISTIQGKWEAFQVFFLQLAAWMGFGVDTMLAAFDNFNRGLVVVGDTFNIMYQIVRDGVSALVGFVKGDFNALLAFWEEWGETVKGFFRGLWDDIKDMLAGVIGDIKRGAGAIATVARGASEEIGLTQGPGLEFGSFNTGGVGRAAMAAAGGGGGGPFSLPEVKRISDTNITFNGITDTDSMINKISDEQRSKEFGSGGV